MVITKNTPAGEATHYLYRSFGKKFGGRGWFSRTSLPKHVKKLTVMTSYSDKVDFDWLAPYNAVNCVKSWTEVIQELMKRYNKAKVAVIPDATVQYFPDASN